MNTFLHFLQNLKSVPMVTTWELEELAQMKGQAAVWKRIRVLPLIEGKNKGTEE